MKKHLYILFLLLALSACVRETAYLACEQVETIKEFPINIEEKALSPLPIDVPGCVDITVADSFLICKYIDGDYFWKVYSLNDCQFRANLFRKGHGKNETADLPTCERVIVNDTSVSCDVMTFENKLYRCHIQRSIDCANIITDDITPKKSGLSDMLATLYSVNDSTYFVKWIKKYGFSRALYQNNKDVPIDNIGNLNDVFNNKELNSLSAGSFLCSAKNKMVEAMLCLNQLHIYSLDGSWSKTLNIFGEPINLYEVDGQSHKDIVEQFSEVQGNDDYIVALYLGGKETELMENKVKSSILIFDWDGNAKAKVTLPFAASAIDIDDNGNIYLFSRYMETERIYRYKNVNDIVK